MARIFALVAARIVPPLSLAVFLSPALGDAGVRSASRAASTPREPRSQANPQPDQATVTQLTAMLWQFLTDASAKNAVGFEKFFADDVLYTRAAGALVPKRMIMRSVSNAEQSEDVKVTYSADEIVIHTYGDTAVMAFRLAERTALADGRTEQANFRNTGTFLRRNGQWQAVAWQSTRILERAAGR